MSFSKNSFSPLSSSISSTRRSIRPPSAPVKAVVPGDSPFLTKALVFSADGTDAPHAWRVATNTTAKMKLGRILRANFLECCGVKRGMMESGVWTDTDSTVALLPITMPIISQCKMLATNNLRITDLVIAEVEVAFTVSGQFKARRTWSTPINC